MVGTGIQARSKRSYQSLVERVEDPTKNVQACRRNVYAEVCIAKSRPEVNFCQLGNFPWQVLPTRFLLLCDGRLEILGTNILNSEKGDI